MSRNKVNWSRPRFKTQGRTVESINGSDLATVLGGRKRPPQPKKSKAELRLEAEKLVAEFRARQAAEGGES